MEQTVNWWFWGNLSLLLLVLAVVFAVMLWVLTHKRKSLVTPGMVFLCGSFVSAFALVFPVSVAEYGGIRGAALSFLQVLRMYALDLDFVNAVWSVDHADAKVKMLYDVLSLALVVLAPLQTARFVLLLFKNLSAKFVYLTSFWKHTHVFSELNRKTLALANSLVQKSRFGTLIVFTDIVDKQEETSLELMESAKTLGAVLFRKDLDSIRFRNKHSLRKLSFYLISDDEPEKLRHAVSVMNRYDYPGVDLRVFSTDIRSELLLAAKSAEKMNVIRIDDVQTLIYHHLDRYGVNLFEHARELENKAHVISAVIVGLGKYGCEMLKALSWFCQVKGYHLKINAFDSDAAAEARFTALCPDLMNPQYNGAKVEGEAEYEITVHSGIHILSPEFEEKLSQITDATYVFVCLGEDEVNLDAATKIRSICERVSYIGDGHKPDIETVIYDSNIAKLMGVTWDDVMCPKQTPVGAKNYKREPYNILMIGDLERFYSVETMIDSELIEAGKEVNARWAMVGAETKEEREKKWKEAEQLFWKYEYNYQSSIAKAIHERLRRKFCPAQVIGSHTPWEKLTDEEKLAIGLVEHPRWNAYMRAEGYRYGTKRNDLAKQHHNLIPTTKLTDDDLRKDA